MKDIINMKGVRAYLDENDTVQLNLEDVARGLGFTTETVSATSGKKYENVRWARVKGHLVAFGLMESVEDEAPEYIAESYFYWLAMKAGNKTAEEFQRLVCFEILPAIRKRGSYVLANKGHLPVQYLGAVATTINTLRRIMIDQGCDPTEIAKMAKSVCDLYHLPLPAGFIRESPYTQLAFETTVTTTTLKLN